MALTSDSPLLRTQVQVVVGSIENLLNELQGVAADLKVVVNQIDDVTARIEQTHKQDPTVTSPVGSGRTAVSELETCLLVYVTYSQPAQKLRGKSVLFPCLPGPTQCVPVAFSAKPAKVKGGRVKRDYTPCYRAALNRCTLLIKAFTFIAFLGH